MVFNKGISDMPCTTKSYSVWHSMIRRCYSEVYHKLKPTYKGTEVTEEWLKLSTFNKWFNLNYIDGWQLDKDLISNFTKLYSPDTCCFLPNEVNSALHFDMGRNKLLPGVSFKTESGKYIAQHSRNDSSGKRKSIHLLSSTDQFECFLAYKKAKENYLKELAQKYQQSLNPRAYEKLMTLEVQTSYH